jgi:2-methylisocitrate lyase-like PEP mutase family enzyme
MPVGDRRARFRALHERSSCSSCRTRGTSARHALLASAGFEALATTSAGFAWSLGKHDQHVTRDELVAHVAALTEATTLPLNVDSERCYPDDPGGVAQTVVLLAGAGAAGFSIEDYDPATDGIDDVGLAAERVAVAAEAAHGLAEPMVLTGRAENHIRGVDDVNDTIVRLIAYRDAGADCLYAPGLADVDQIAAVVDAVGAPVNVLALPNGPAIAELAAVGVRRVSTGSLLAAAAYGALMAGARELLTDGTSSYGRASFGRVPATHSHDRRATVRAAHTRLACALRAGARVASGGNTRDDLPRPVPTCVVSGAGCA